MAVFKLLLKVITLLRLSCLIIGLKISRQFFDQLEAESKPIAACVYPRFFPRFEQVAGN